MTEATFNVKIRTGARTPLEVHCYPFTTKVDNKMLINAAGFKSALTIIEIRDIISAAVTDRLMSDARFRNE